MNHFLVQLSEILQKDMEEVFVLFYSIFQFQHCMDNIQVVNIFHQIIWSQTYHRKI